MSYQSFKRVLGESNLERKCLLWFGVSLGVLLFLCFYVYGLKMEYLVDGSDRKLGPELVRAAWLEAHFNIEGKLNAKESPEDLSIEEQVSADIYQRVKESSRAIGSAFEWYAILPPDPNAPPETAGEFVYYFPNKDKPAQVHDDRDLLAHIFDNPHRPEKDNDEQAEPNLLYGLPENAAEKQFRTDGKQKYRFYSPLYAENQSCVICHKSLDQYQRTHLAEGDLIAVICVEVDQEQAHGAMASLRSGMWVAAIVIGFLSMSLLYFIIRYVIVKPVQHLRDVTNAVREGDVEQRAEIQTGDEFEELASSFNRMLRRLLRQQDALKDVNEELDAKIDQIAQANMRLFEMNRLKSDFLATMSHELRTPLNSILGFSDVLAGIDALEDKQKRYVANIQRSGRMLLEMINDILDLAKMESGKMDIRPSEFRIDAVVSAQCDMARPLSERKNIDLECEFEQGLPAVRQDQGKVQQILNNLLSNAIKFTPEGGRIIVRAARHDDQMLRLTVEDTGVGISEADQSIVFEKFRQGGSAQPQGNAMTREHSGTGLGLSIIRELCRLLGGEVSLSSVLGKGSTFTVVLPWTVSVNQNLEAQMQQEVAELTRASLAGLEG